MQIKVYIDANQVGDNNDRISTSGYCTFVERNLVTWRSKKQNVVAQSSTKFEFQVVAHGIYELVWLKMILEELRIPYEKPKKLYCDNKAAINIAHNLVQHDRTKHVEVDRHFIKKKLERDLIFMSYVHTRKQLAYILTKGLQKHLFEVLEKNMGMLNLHTSLRESGKS